jgi:GntR family transcriptional repressor for pyruvate dehydrogenase complex
MFRSEQKQSVTEETAERIVQMIRDGNFTPGDKLPSERQLVKEIKVGRTSVREAIGRLEAVGLLEVRQGLGTFVKDPGSRILQTSLAPHVVTDQQKLEELFETRGIIEIAAASLAAQRADAYQIAEMRRWVQMIETLVLREDARGIATADVEFHRQIIIATGNNTLAALMDSLVDLLHDMRYDSSNIPELLPEIVNGHRAILAAIEAGDSLAASQAMKEHLGSVATRVKEFWQRRIEPTAGESK